jgi:hypothetical protein
MSDRDILLLDMGLAGAVVEIPHRLMLGFAGGGMRVSLAL